MAESDDDYETRMLRDTIPRGLRSDYGAPPRERTPPPRDHLLGSTGEGRDKDVTPPKTPMDPNVQGAPDSGASGIIPDIIITFNGTAYYNDLDGKTKGTV